MKPKQGRQILVCMAECTWTPHGLPDKGDRKFYYVDYGNKGSYTNVSWATLTELAHQIVSCGELSSQDTITYEPPKKAEMYFGDGYFGRPAIPAEGYLFKPLRKKQMETLSRQIAKFRKSS
jgi:hypothetical protein